MANVLMISAEAVPFAKVGGMADVVGSLPAALRRIGVDARVLLPGYGSIEHLKYNITFLFSFQFTHNQGTSDVTVYTTVRDGVPYYFVQAWPYFGQESSVYTDYSWDLPRFIFFSQVSMAVAWELQQRIGWFPDVFHTHDWHTGLVPYLIEQNSHQEPWRSVATLLSIHNLAYQGDYGGYFLYQAGIPPRTHPHLVYQDLTDNQLGIAIAYSNIVTTVSPRYAIEIQYPYQGYGLDGLVRTRINDLYGILNGIDVDLWNPATDKKIAQNYDATNFREKRAANKAALQRSLDLPERPDIPIIGLVSRLVEQKGIDLLVQALRRLITNYDVQFVALGTGEPRLEHEVWKLAYDLGNRGARARIGFDAAVANLIYAGSDIFAMPSHFEPCGMGQMIAMRYGSLPLVRETGGLADTVENYDNGSGDHGTGFVFNWEQFDALYNTMRWAIETYWNRREAWELMQERAMTRDFSWDLSAQKYADLYEKAMRKKRGLE